MILSKCGRYCSPGLSPASSLLRKEAEGLTRSEPLSAGVEVSAFCESLGKNTSMIVDREVNFSWVEIDALHDKESKKINYLTSLPVMRISLGSNISRSAGYFTVCTSVKAINTGVYQP